MDNVRGLLVDIRKAKNFWQDWRKPLDGIEAWLEEAPGQACRELFVMIFGKFRELRADLRRFGVEVRLGDGVFEPELVYPDRLPKTLSEHAEYNDAVEGIGVL